jgi:hypothetical protein
MIGASLLGRRIGIFIGLAQTIAAQQEDLGVLDEAVGNGGRDGRIKEDVAPVGEGRVGGDYCGTFVAVSGRDDLIKEVGGLLVKGEVSELVTDEE